jgi:hypothetical protein
MLGVNLQNAIILRVVAPVLCFLPEICEIKLFTNKPPYFKLVYLSLLVSSTLV